MIQRLLKAFWKGFWAWRLRHNKRFMAGVHRGIEAYHRGDVLPWSDVKKELGLMAWRPEGWKNPYKDTSKHYPFEHYRPVKIACDAFECGADAMLKALREKGAWMTPEQMRLLAPDRKYPYGYIIFIPDAEGVKSEEKIDQRID